MLRITRTLFVDERDLQERHIRAQGPGGQHVNKVSTAVQLKYDPCGVAPLPGEILERLRARAGARMTTEGTVVITARKYRSQERNRQDARERLAQLIRSAAVSPRSRKATRPSRAARERRLQHKRRVSEKKKSRHFDPRGD